MEDDLEIKDVPAAFGRQCRKKGIGVVLKISRATCRNLK